MTTTSQKSVIPDVVEAFRQCGDLYVVPKVDLAPLAELFRAKVLTLLKKEGRIDDALIANLLTWRHNSGFSVHNGGRLARDDEAGREALAQYIIRNPFAVSKITYNPVSGMVINKSKPTPSGSKGGRRNFQVFSATEFTAAITQHIPEKSFQLVRYYGWYSNRGRGGRANRQADAAAQSPPPAEVEVLNVSDYRPRKIPSPTWRECIKKVWEIDPLTCPKCGGEMKIISFITEAAIIRRILEHLGLWTVKKPKPAAPHQPLTVKGDMNRSTMAGLSMKSMMSRWSRCSRGGRGWGLFFARGFRRLG
ncbi:transposase [Desulfurivibrio dismutans]|uniref:transposase n=1 Tax=Desulfurivibrio dismutans TaxID=1398908 RepID=UPI0023DA62B2|nr:transposase [Desulfurivibrio alkaliphilus]MDF1615605.1 transposase [Desulfurivibrio alkaliphilus]